MINCCFVSSFPEYLLDRTIILGKDHEHRVSGYKLARASEYFCNQLKEIRIKELERFKQKSKEEPNIQVNPIPTPRSRTRSLSEIDNDRIKVNYNDTGGLEYILSFIHCQDDFYNPNLTLTIDNALSVLKAGIFFKVSTVMDFCMSQIQTNINVDNCWQYWNIAIEILSDYSDLAKFVEYYILENFPSAVISDHILKLDVNQLKSFLKNDFLNSRDEIKLLALIDKWIDHEPADRLITCPDLLGCLRLGRLSSEDLNKVINNRFIVKSWKDCSQLLTWAKMSSEDLNINVQSLSGNVKQGDINEIITYLHKPRLPREAIVVVGGWEGNQDDPNFGPSKAIQVYDNRSNTWTRIIGESMGLDEGHAYSGCILHKNKVYVIGGYVSSGPTQTLKMFDLATKQWKYLSPMHEKRNYITTCLLEDFIYAIGGHNGRNRLSSVERYDSSQNHWSFVSPMRQVRSDAGCDSLFGKLYVCGGFDGHHFYASVEVYDPKVDQWSTVSPMGNIRSGVSVVTHKQFIYAIGGNDGLQRLRTVERYDPIANRWQTMPPMIRQRSNFCLAVLEDEIYVMGGWSDETNSTIALVEKWQPGLNNVWASVQQLFMPASANCCCSIKGIESIREFLNR